MDRKPARVALMSQNSLTDALYRLLQALPAAYEPVCFVEKDFRKWSGGGDGLPVFPMAKAVEEYRRGNLDRFLIPSLEERVNEGMFEALTQEGVAAEDVLYAPVKLWRGGLPAGELPRLVTAYEERTELGTIEIHAADHCNLNCKNCSMFCGLAKDERFPSYPDTRAGLLLLQKRFDHVKKFRIIGGEPLLNGELYRYVDLARELFPYTDIRVITNGILVKKMPERLKESLRRQNATLVVTQYPPLESGMFELHQFLEKEHIRHEITDTVKEFRKIYDLAGGQDPELSFRKCCWKKECATLYGYKMATCFVPFVIHYAADAFSLSIPESGVIDLEEGLTAGEIRGRMNRSFDLCRFCASQNVTESWGIARRKGECRWEEWSI